MKNLKNKKGFTIVELVIVIAVIAILAAVLIPTFSGVIERANKSAVQQGAANALKAVYLLDMEDNLLDGLNNGSALTLPDGCSNYNVDATNGVITSLTYAENSYTTTYNGTTWTEPSK